ncbi:MAG: hypothetical protein KatS3mg087_1623 [Patescibacteria group bacterium]|nr:MAG: hypothetical protein KatS3mg087_1623 [Patescibacteria group bacterium]
MAVVNGTNYDKYAGTDKSDTTPIGRGKWEAQVLVQTDVYEASSLASGSTINVARLPAGAVVLDAAVYFDALGTSTTVSLGTSADTDKYIAAASSASAGVLRMNQVDGVQDALTADTDIVVAIGGASATGTIKTVVVYSL